MFETPETKTTEEEYYSIWIKDEDGWKIRHTQIADLNFARDKAIDLTYVYTNVQIVRSVVTTQREVVWEGVLTNPNNFRDLDKLVSNE